MKDLNRAFDEEDPAPHSLVALFDEAGRMQGCSTSFASDCTASLAECRKGIADLWPEFEPERWAQIWSQLQSSTSPVVCQVRSNFGASQGQPVELEVCRFVGPGAPLAKVEVRSIESKRLRLLQQELLEQMATGQPLQAIMETLSQRAEALAPSVICSVLAVDAEKRLHHVASPSLPKEYSSLVDGVAIGPAVGSCGTAAYLGQPVEVTDIETDLRWADYKQLVLPLGLRACWSSPIKASDGRVLGVFAFYYPVPRGPTLIERQIVEKCLSLCSIAFEHEETRARAYSLAFRDQLTGLANRARFIERVTGTMTVAEELGDRVAIEYVGIDHYQLIADSLGVTVADDLLKIIGSRLQTLVRDLDTVARVDSDQFAFVLVGDLAAKELAARAAQLIDTVAKPCLVGGQLVEPAASIGIALTPEDGQTAEELVSHAALAMRRVRELGGRTYYFYEKEINARMQARRLVEMNLHAAIIDRQFELHYQPIVDLKTSQIVAAEALLRWRHPERGLIAPSDFIPVAEETGLIVELGEWALNEACRTAMEWPGRISVSVNLSPVQFEKPGLVEMVTRALASSGLPASRLELEITESVPLLDNAANVAVLDALSERGSMIALDDFGTGYASLSYLQRFSFNKIKIDRSFVRDMAEAAESLKIVRAIVMLAHSLGLSVTAEGVETEEQLVLLANEGCDGVQGFHIGSPMPRAQFAALLSEPWLTSRYSAA
jgi:diguanylate cyclase (GGDEF)-like protein